MTDHTNVVERQKTMRCFQCDNYSLPCTCGKIFTIEISGVENW